MNIAQSGDEIWVAEATNGYTISNLVPDGVGLYGGFEATESSRDQRNWVTNQIVINNSSMSMSGTTVVDGFKFVAPPESGLLQISGNATFLHNIVTGCEESENLIECTGGIKLLNNLIYGNMSCWLIRCWPYAGNEYPTIANNTIVNNCLGGYDVGFAITCNGSETISNNILVNNGYGIYVNEGATPTISHNCVYYPYEGAEDWYYHPSSYSHPTDIHVDPLFVDAANNNYHLQSTSPCIDAGDDSAVESGWVDLDGRLRQVDHVSGGSQVDIGAYEYPIALGTINCPEYTTASCFTVSYDGVADTASTISEVKLWYKYGANGTWTYYGSNQDSSSSGSFGFWSFDGYGTYYFALSVSDNAGNYTGDPTAQTVAAGSTGYEEYDTHAPTLGTLTCPATANTPFYVHYSGVQDIESGLSSVTLWYKYGSNGTWTQSSCPSQAGESGDFYFTPSSGNGTYYFALSATDNNANHTAEPPTAAAGSTDFALTVTINQASTQTEDPTYTAPINYTVIFSEPVTGFATGDVTLGGTAGPLAAVVTQTGTSGTTYNVAVTGMSTTGTVIASIAASVAQDAAGNPNVASTWTDNTVTYNADPGFIWSTKVSDWGCESIAMERLSNMSLGDIFATGSATGNWSVSYRMKLDSTNGSMENDYGTVASHATVAHSWYPGSFSTVSLSWGGGSSIQANKVDIANYCEWAFDTSTNSGFVTSPDCVYSGYRIYCAVGPNGHIYVPYTAENSDNLFEIRLREFTNTTGPNASLDGYNDTPIYTTDTAMEVGGIAIDSQGGVYIAYAIHGSAHADLYIIKVGNNPWTGPRNIDSISSEFQDEPDFLTFRTPIAVSPSGSIYIAHHYPIMLGIDWASNVEVITRLDVDSQGAVTNETGAFLGGTVSNSLPGAVLGQETYKVDSIALYNNNGTDELYLLGNATNTDATHLPITNYFQTSSQAFVAVLNGSTLGVDYCSYLGQDNWFGKSIAVDSSGGVYVGMETGGLNMDNGGYICKLRFPSN